MELLGSLNVLLSEAEEKVGAFSPIGSVEQIGWEISVPDSNEKLF